MATMTQEWQQPHLPDWAATGVAWLATVIAAGGAKPAFDWWRDRGKEQRTAKKDELDTATALRKELHESVRELRADLDKRDNELDAVRRELYELLAKIASLTAENHDLRAADHRLRAWLAGFYATLQMRWKQAGLPMEQFPDVPGWVNQSPDGPTASKDRLRPEQP